MKQDRDYLIAWSEPLGIGLVSCYELMQLERHSFLFVIVFIQISILASYDSCVPNLALNTFPMMTDWPAFFTVFDESICPAVV